jgi:hypothetical protein
MVDVRGSIEDSQSPNDTSKSLKRENKGKVLLTLKMVRNPCRNLLIFLKFIDIYTRKTRKRLTNEWQLSMNHLSGIVILIAPSAGHARIVAFLWCPISAACQF